jgi:hypothetical protein
VKLFKFVLILVTLSVSSFAFGQTLKFSMQSTQNASGVTPTLTWCTEQQASPGLTCSGTPATSCTASGDWSGSKPAAGSEVLPVTKVTKSFVLDCQWPGKNSLKVGWTPPTLNTDGTPLTTLAGYRIYYSTSPAMTNNQVKLISSSTATTDTITGLTPGSTYYMVIRAFNTQNIESDNSSPVLVATLQSTASVAQSVKVTFPNPPTGLTVE